MPLLPARVPSLCNVGVMCSEGRTDRAHLRAGDAARTRGSGASFVLARAGSSRLLAASLGLSIVFSVAVTTALAGFGASALPEAVHQRLASAASTSAAISGQVGAAKAGADTRVIDSLFRSALGGVPFTLSTGRWSDGMALPRPRGSRVISTIQAAALGGVASHVGLVAGNWPGPRSRGQPVGVALPASTARMLGLSVGEVLALRDTQTGAPVRLVVVGLFRVRDPASPYWQLSLLGTAGYLVTGSFITYGPMLVDPGALGPGGLTVGDASWVARIDTARIPPASIPQLQRRLARLVSVLQDRQSLGGLQVSTRLPRTLSELASSLVVSRSLLLIGTLELVLLALAAVALAARLLASQREEETALLNARGVARGQLTLVSLAEAVLLAVPAAAAGIMLGGYGAGLLLSASGLPASGARGLTGMSRVIMESRAWWPAAIIAVLAVIVMVWPAFRPDPPGKARVRRGRQAALSTVARAGLDVALVALGLLALWELRRYSAVPRLSGGELGVDPVLAAAPVVALVGISLVPLRLLPVLARRLDRVSARARHADAALAGWQLARRPRRQVGPILLVMLAVATGTLALAQHQSWRQSQLDQASFAGGADVRVDLASPLALSRAGTLAHATGVVSAMPVASHHSGFSLLALDARAATGTVLLRPDLSPLPAATLWQRIIPGGGRPGLELPGKPTRLEITAMVRPAAAQHLGALPVDLSVQDGSGIVYQVSAGNLAAHGRSHNLIATLSATRQAVYPLRLLGVSASYTLPSPVHPGPASIAAGHPQVTAAQSAFLIGGLAVSDRAAGSMPPRFATGAALASWHPLAAAAELADPRARGTPPAIAAWRAAGGSAELTFTAGSGELVERPWLPPIPVSGQFSVTAGNPAAPLPAIATAAFLSSAGAGVGDVVRLPVGSVNVPVRLMAEVRGFPTVASGQPAVIVDLGQLGDALAARSQPPLPVTQWWLRTGSGIPAGLPPGAAVTTRAGLAAGLLADPLPNVQQLGSLVIVIAAGLLACVGFAVSVAAAVRERRLTDAVLAALGVGPAARAGQLCLEQLMLSVPAAAAGALIGVILARLLVPAVILTSAAAAPFPPARVEIPLILLALLALAVAAIPVAAAATTVGYRPDPAAQLRAGESA
jgi:FtsX-like permease family protein